MKKSVWFVALLLAGITCLPSLAAYVPPTDDQIAAVLADHSQLDALIQGAKPEQVAAVVSRALTSLNSSTLSEASKTQVAALIYTRAFLLSGENAPQMAKSLASQVDVKLIPALAAATAVAVGSSEGPVINSFVSAVGAGTPAAQAVSEAAANPGSALSADSLALVQQLVIDLRGVAAPVIPPPATAPMNLVPPIVPIGATQPAPPPPVAETYVNQ